jgi:hypothetical protein
LKNRENRVIHGTPGQVAVIARDPVIGKPKPKSPPHHIVHGCGQVKIGIVGWRGQTISTSADSARLVERVTLSSTTGIFLD